MVPVLCPFLMPEAYHEEKRDNQCAIFPFQKRRIALIILMRRRGPSLRKYAFKSEVSIRGSLIIDD